jgi:exodeoxyribonuclease VII large subunit
MELFESELTVYSVSELNALAQELLETNFPDIWVEGEISNFRSYPSGHLYFTLKDEGAELDAVMFRPLAAYLEFQPQDGRAVLARGTLTVYGPRGRYQLEVHRLKPAGLGKLQLAFERLKERLQAEGLFDEAHKRPLPSYPERIGLITSTEGAAIRDMISIIARRYPAAQLRVFPVKVQGGGAAEEIAAAISLANRYHAACEPLDVLIVGRGGGSLEDLWAFNEEIVARAIHRSRVPVVSAVGHEIDFTIADLVADLRAPTPSAAAELVVPDRAELLSRIRELAQRLTSAQGILLRELQVQLERLVERYAFRKPLRRLHEGQQTLDALSERLGRAFRDRRQALQDRAEALLGRLEAANPLTLLRRGYAIACDERGRTIRSTKDVHVGQRVTIKLYQGKMLCEVLSMEPDDLGI